MRCFFILWLILIALASLQGASLAADTLPDQRNVYFKGYVKYLHQIAFVDLIRELQTSNLIHNRLQFQWKPNERFTFRTDVRNRLYYGEQIRSVPQFDRLLENPTEFIHLSNAWYSKGAVVAHSTIDRLYMDITRKKVEVTVGRQRINWGINTLWTPNDIFNTYNFFDFDYEERPGSDAIRVQYTPKTFSTFEAAYAPGKKADGNVGAVLYRFNKWNYDIQSFAGLIYSDWTAGVGWAGNLGDAGFKGETTWLEPNKKTSPNRSRDVLSTATLDYGWEHGWYTGVSYLYHQSGGDTFNSVASLYAMRPSLRTFMPFRHSGSIIINKTLSPLMTAGGVFIYSNTSNTLIAVPSLTYTPADNWEVYLTAQLFFANQESRYKSLGNMIFLRMKLAF
jgi:hypothetical protein